MKIADIRRLQADEHADFAALLRVLLPHQWDQPSLCAGWTVRDVVAHLAGWDALLTVPEDRGYLPAVFALSREAARSRFSAARMNERILAERADAAPEQLVLEIDRPGVAGAPRVFDRLAPGSQLAEYVVHHQDIIRPLGLARVIPEERLVVALSSVGRLPGVGASRRARGLRLHATDVGWAAGRGPEVHGPGEALLLAVSGREVALRELDGDGAPTLAERLSST